MPAYQAFEGGDPRLVLLDKVCGAGVIVERTTLVFVDPDADQLAGSIVTLGQTMQRLAAEVLRDEMPLELEKM